MGVTVPALTVEQHYYSLIAETTDRGREPEIRNSKFEIRKKRA
jgi:hypothetical protein